jgi:hypothetical protein
MRAPRATFWPSGRLARTMPGRGPYPRKSDQFEKSQFRSKISSGLRGAVNSVVKLATSAA